MRVGLLGLAQICAWGSLYYTLGILSPAIAQETGTSEGLIFGAFSAGLLIAGLIAPRVGKLIDRQGARPVLACGSVCAAIALAMLASAQGPWTIVAAWLVGGFAFAATLYDAAFAALNQLTREHYRRAVTGLTLFGGFASTVFWPLTHALQNALGWRETLWLYAAMHLFLTAPLHWFTLPRVRTDASGGNPPDAAGTPAPPAEPAPHPAFFWLATSFALGSAVVAVVGVHMVGLLTGTGLAREAAVLAAMAMGPAQVVGRVVEITLLKHLSASRIGLMALGAMLLSLVLLVILPAWLWVAWLFVVLYGLGNGVLTIVRGSAPAELMGHARLGYTLGRLSRPATIAKALAPGLFAWLIGGGVSQDTALLGVALLAAGALISLHLAAKTAALTPALSS